MAVEQLVSIPAEHDHIEAMLALPDNVIGLVLFAHGSGSSRHSPRNNYVAKVLRNAGIGTLLIDLLTPEEDMHYQMRFDIPLLTRRLQLATKWVKSQQSIQHLPLGYFGASTGAAAALQAAVTNNTIKAVVSRGGRPDLAGAQVLAKVQSPTLFLVGALDSNVIELNRDAYDLMRCLKELVIVPDATHLFEEPGTLEAVAHHASNWLSQYLMT